MGFAIFTFFVVFMLLASGGMLLFYREAMTQRMPSVITPGTKQGGRLLDRVQQTRSSLGGILGQFERVLPRSQAEVSITRQRLIRAGFRSESALNVFYSFKVLVPVTLAILVLITGFGDNSFFVYALALALGFLSPDFWIGRKIKQRQMAIRQGLPDVLDLMIICVEAGLGLDQAIIRTADELSRGQPAICDELGVVVLEQRAGRARSDAWRNFADRCAVDSVRNLVSVLMQSEQFGTGIAKTLRIHSDTLRTQRRQRVEEQAAKTSIKLVFPLVLFIFPSLFLVTLGPEVIIMMESFARYFSR
jgi:tight adherence protein C